MRHKYDSDGDTLKNTRKHTDPNQEEAHLAQLSYTSVPVGMNEMMTVAARFRDFIHRDDGYLKVKREADASQVHFTWTYTLGQWAKHYLYVRVEYYDVPYGLNLLWQKIEDVDAGRRQPTPDRWRLD